MEYSDKRVECQDPICGTCFSKRDTSEESGVLA